MPVGSARRFVDCPTPGTVVSMALAYLPPSIRARGQPVLTIHDPRLSRRAFLQIGGLALGGLTLPGWLAARASDSKQLVSDKSVIFLFLHGGPSQIETFDPKMSAPEGIRSATGEIATALPGVTFGSSFPKLAKLAERLAVVRSYVPGDANHDIKPIVCKDGFS